MEYSSNILLHIIILKHDIRNKNLLKKTEYTPYLSLNRTIDADRGIYLNKHTLKHSWAPLKYLRKFITLWMT